MNNLNVNIDSAVLEYSGMDFHISDTKTSKLYGKEGEFISSKQYRIPIRGKHGIHNLMVSTSGSGKKLRVEGSLGGFIYGQNVFTPPDMRYLAFECIKNVCINLGWKPPKELINAWRGGDIAVRRADVAVNYQLISEEQVWAAIQQIKLQTVLKDYRTEGHGTSICLMRNGGKNGSRTYYAKGAEMRYARGNKRLPHAQRLLKLCERLLRVEERLLSPELKDLTLQRVSDWKKNSALTAFNAHSAKYDFLEINSGPVTDKELNDPRIRSCMKPALLLHKAGIDLSIAYEEDTLNRRRLEFREIGIDIDVPNQPALTVMSLAKLLSPEKSARAPVGMINAGLYPADDI